MFDRLFNFVAAERGPWRIESIEPVLGETLPLAPTLHVIQGAIDPPPVSAAWHLRGVTSHERYVTRDEHEQLAAAQPALGRPSATSAALIPITKSETWWQLSQDERRRIFEERSHHIATGVRSLPAVARRLHHSRDLGEPFDFLTWFEYAPADRMVFDNLVRALRATEEWAYVVREIDIRLSRA